MVTFVYGICVVVLWIFLGAVVNAMMYRMDKNTVMPWGEYSGDKWLATVFAPFIFFMIIFWVIPNRVISGQKVFYR